MRYILKNTFRSMLKNCGAHIGGICVIALGILIYVSMANMANGLKTDVDNYYRDYNFADVFAYVKAIPENKLKKLENIEGIEIADGRLAEDVRIMLENSSDIVTLHIMSYDKNSSLNKLMVSNSKLENGQIFIGNGMTSAYNFSSNDNLNLIIDGNVRTFKMAGTVQAPDYILSIPPSGGMPDSKIYDIACIDKYELQKLLNKTNILNELSFKLEAGYKFSDVKYQLETELKKYGLTNLTQSEYQSSNYTVNIQIGTFISLSTVLPAIFLSVSVFMLYIILKKMIDQNRTLIGTLKAFGFKNLEIVAVYMMQSVATGLLGGVLGSILAFPFSKYLFNIVISVFNIPNDGFKFYFSNVYIGISISVFTSIFATYFGIKDILNINPSEAMRQIAPKFNSNLKFLSIYSSKQLIGIRAIFRNKLRSFAIALSIAFPFALITVMISFLSVQKQMLLSQFTKIHTYDLKINFNEYKKYNDALNSILSLDGVYNAEAIAEYGIDIKYKNLSTNTSLKALNSNSPIYKIMDIDNIYYQPRSDGIIVDYSTAQKLNLNQGDTVTVKSDYLGESKLKVVKIINEFTNSGCYIDINGIPKFFNVNKNANAVVFKTYSKYFDSIKTFLSNTKNISSVIDRDTALEGYRLNLQSNSSLISIFCILSIIAGIVLIYNISNINLRERKNEFGTMNILGFTFREIAMTIVFENVAYLILSIIISFPMVSLFKKAMELMLSSDGSFILQLKPSSYALSATICIGIIVISILAILRNLSKIDLTDTLKERE